MATVIAVQEADLLKMNDASQYETIAYFRGTQKGERMAEQFINARYAATGNAMIRAVVIEIRGEMFS